MPALERAPARAHAPELHEALSTADAAAPR